MELEHEDSEFIQHEPCPKCGSRDNLARYTDGHAYHVWTGGYANTTSALTGVRFSYSNSAEYDAGTFKLFGIKDS